ncbi:hypothetical protein [Acetobacter estunensis]|uniref:hypothetical protein n=1 Tax=Acetobacter estunensis TaxID=104097 RepID=UPI001C2D50F8|nr:hypothetical protein [Acetobacter estunensis]MBV1838029.1 hypothetical protein [Acetobacter estunensis]
MNRHLRTLLILPALLGALAGTAALPATAHAQPWRGGPGSPGWGGGPRWGGPGPGEWRHHHSRGEGGLVAGGIIGGLAVGTLAGMAIANSPPPAMVYAPPPPPPPPAYVVPAYPVAPVAPVYGGYGGYGVW